MDINKASCSIVVSTQRLLFLAAGEIIPPTLFPPLVFAGEPALSPILYFVSFLYLDFQSDSISKKIVKMSSEEEKGDMGPSQFKARSASTSEEAVGPIISENKDSFATRYGFNLTSFKKKESGADIELERPMKTRHLHMISIGKKERKEEKNHRHQTIQATSFLTN